MSRATSFLFLTVTVSTLLQVESKCPTLFEEFNKACYYYGNNAVTSPQAAFRTCKSLGGYLLNINADLEHEHTIDRLKVQTKLFDGYWIGGKYYPMDNLWFWERVDSNGIRRLDSMNPDETQYRHWGPGQPNAYALGGLEYKPFVAIMVRGRRVPFAWYAMSMYAAMPGGISYICEASWAEDV